MRGARLTRASRGQALTDRLTLKPYWGKPAVRNFRGGGGNVGIIRSPVRATALPDYVPHYDYTSPIIGVVRKRGRIPQGIGETGDLVEDRVVGEGAGVVQGIGYREGIPIGIVGVPGHPAEGIGGDEHLSS